jgi:hypothetical protein
MPDYPAAVLIPEADLYVLISLMTILTSIIKDPLPDNLRR